MNADADPVGILLCRSATSADPLCRAHLALESLESYLSSAYYRITASMPAGGSSATAAPPCPPRRGSPGPPLLSIDSGGLPGRRAAGSPIMAGPRSTGRCWAIELAHELLGGAPSTDASRRSRAPILPHLSTVARRRGSPCGAARFTSSGTGTICCDGFRVGRSTRHSSSPTTSH